MSSTDELLLQALGDMDWYGMLTGPIGGFIGAAFMFGVIVGWTVSTRTVVSDAKDRIKALTGRVEYLEDELSSQHEKMERLLLRLADLDR